jgi:hypothetical protein
MSALIKPMSAAELKAARSAAAVRFEAIGKLYVPEGYTVEYRKSLSGRHWGSRKLIQAPRPITRKALYIFLHECAHAVLGHSHNGKVPRYAEEMQAEQWAHAKMREHGVAVPRIMTRRAKQYVARKIGQAMQRGAKRIDPKARAFASTASTAD